jgi:hypothetical protein
MADGQGTARSSKSSFLRGLAAFDDSEAFGGAPPPIFTRLVSAISSFDIYHIA